MVPLFILEEEEREEREVRILTPLPLNSLGPAHSLADKIAQRNKKTIGTTLPHSINLEVVMLFLEEGKKCTQKEFLISVSTTLE